MSNQQIIDSYYRDREEPASDFRLLINDMEGKQVAFDLSEIGNVFADDDIIYISGIPCRLSSARWVGGDCPECDTFHNEIHCFLCGEQIKYPDEYERLICNGNTKFAHSYCWLGMGEFDHVTNWEAENQKLKMGNGDNTLK